MDAEPAAAASIRAVGSIDGTGNNPGCEKVAGAERLYRVRAGVYGVVYQSDDEVLLVLVVAIGHRSDVYRRL